MPRRIEILQPLLLAAILAIGLGTVWAVPMEWGVHMVKELFGTVETFEYLEFRADGTPVIETERRPDYENCTYRDLEGNPLSISRNEAWLGNGYLANANGAEYDFEHPWRGGFRWEEQMIGSNDGGQPMTYWYFVCAGEPPRSGYFVGFDSVGKRCIGYMGRNGFRPTMPPAEERFPWHHQKVTYSVVVGSQYQSPDREPTYGGSSAGPGQFPPPLVYVLADDGLVEVDLLKRSSRLVLKQSGLLSAQELIRAMSTPMTRDSAAYLSQAKGYLAVRAKDRILILNPAGKLESSFTIPVEFRDARAFIFCLLSDDSAILDVPSADLRSVPPYAADHWQLLWIDAKGNVLRQKDYRIRRGYFADRLKFSPRDTAMAAPAPLAVAAVSVVLAPSYSLWIGTDSTYRGALSRSWSESWPALLATCLLGGVLAWLCYRRQQRYGLPWTKTWMAFVFLGGLPGLVGYLAHRRWPTIEKCPACGRAVPRDREACLRCGNEFPEPTPKGTEVFA